METKNLTCIVCPMGCSLTATIDDNGIKITGNTCKRGEQYGIGELTRPVRVVTTTVRLVDNDVAASCPVKTSAAVDKFKIPEVLRAAAQIRVKSPVKIGDVIIKNVADTGADLTATAQRG